MFGRFNLSLILREVRVRARRGSGKTSRRRLLRCLFTTCSSVKSTSAFRKPNLNILYAIGHRIRKLDSQLGAADRADNSLNPPRAAS
jgi:hypothetical protein